MSGHQRPRHWRASEADAQQYRVAPGTVLARATKAEKRAGLYAMRHASAKTPEARLLTSVDYLRSVIQVARRRDKDRHVPAVPGLDQMIGQADDAIARVARAIEQAGRIPEASTRRPQR
jgi:hypothetical protein